MADSADKRLASVGPKDEAPTQLETHRLQRQEEAARRSEALNMRMAGLSYQKIGERLGVSTDGAEDLVKRTLERNGAPEVDAYRALENSRLDRAQTAIWARVLAGDDKAIDTFLRISASRRRLNGLDAPLDIKLSVNVRHEMEAALAQLEAVVLGEVVRGEVIDSHDERADG
jgi:transposase